MSCIDAVSFFRKFGRKRCPVVPGFTSQEDMDVIASLIHHVGAERMMEIGINEGRTAKAVLDSVPSVKRYVGVDVPPYFKTSHPLQQKEVPVEAGSMVKGDGRVRLIVRDGGSAELNGEEVGEVDVVFIDGDHTYDAVVRDSELARKVVRDGGVIVWHDYCTPAASCDGVRKYIDGRNRERDSICLVVGSNVCFEVVDKGRMKYRMEFAERHHMGDSVCFVAACREFARRTESVAYVDENQELVEAYGDPDHLRFGTEGAWFPVNPTKGHRSREHGGHGNYYGTYLAAVGAHPGGLPRLELPAFPDEAPVAVIQPFSKHADNPPLEYLQGVVDMFSRTTGFPLFAVGLPDTSRLLRGVDYSMLSPSLTRLMAVVRSSVFALVPHSLTAHVAAAYRVPSFVWVQDDGEEWQLDYPDWPKGVARFSVGLEEAGRTMAAALKGETP